MTSVFSLCQLIVNKTNSFHDCVTRYTYCMPLDPVPVCIYLTGRFESFSACCVLCEIVLQPLVVLLLFG